MVPVAYGLNVMLSMYHFLPKSPEAVEQAVRAFEHGARPEKSRFPDPRRRNRRLRRPAGMQPLGPGAFREILDDPACQAAGVAEGIHRLPAVEAHDLCRGERSRHGAEHARRVKARLVDRFRNHHREAA
jgi:hypothetical protein